MAENLDLSELPNMIGRDGSVRHEWRGTVNGVTPEGLARFFHDRYEALAPEYGYETRRASSVPWEDVPPPNKALMRAVAREALRFIDSGGRWP